VIRGHGTWELVAEDEGTLGAQPQFAVGTQGDDCDRAHLPLCLATSNAVTWPPLDSIVTAPGPVASTMDTSRSTATAVWRQDRQRQCDKGSGGRGISGQVVQDGQWAE
jgi:hypothetical protein